MPDLTPSPARPPDAARLELIHRRLEAALVAELTPDGHWEGFLSSSALSTAVAAFALAQFDPVAHQSQIAHARDWLIRHQNRDGSWGHTPCSPGNLATPLPSLAYTDPTSPCSRLVKHSTSPSTRLVLNLVGPAGTNCRGVGFNLKAGDGVSFASFDSMWYAKDKGVFELKNVAPDPLSPPPTPEPVLFAAGVKPGNLLTVGIFQKDRRATAKRADQALVQIALSLDAAKVAGLAPGEVLALAVTKARIIPEDIGDYTSDSAFQLMAKAQMADIQIAVGKLAVQ